MATPFRDRIIAARESLDGNDLFAAWREVLPLAEEHVGSDCELVCDAHGWAIRYTHGNHYREILDDRGARWRTPEDAIEALWQRAERCALALADLFEDGAQ